jgi:hypothetical protein
MAAKSVPLPSPVKVIAEDDDVVLVLVLIGYSGKKLPLSGFFPFPSKHDAV